MSHRQSSRSQYDSERSSGARHSSVSSGGERSHSRQSPHRSGAERGVHSSASGGASKWSNAASAAERGDRPGAWEDEERMNDGEYLQSETRRVQSESRDSTRRALSRLNEASAIAEHNLNLVNTQSEQFNRMERKLDEASVSAKNVDAKVDHLKSLNKWFFLPSFGAGKAARREEEFKRQQESQKFETKQARKREDHWNSRNERLAKSDERIQEYSSKGPRTFYSTPDGVDRDATEEEIDDNLGQISSGLGRLKMMGLQMGEELQNQDAQLKRIDERAGFTQDKLRKLNGKVDQIVDKPRRR